MGGMPDGTVRVPWTPYGQEVGRLVAQDRLIPCSIPGVGIRSSVMQSLKTVGAQPGCHIVPDAFVPMLPGMFFEPSCDPVRQLTFSQRFPFWLTIGRSSFCYFHPQTAPCSSKSIPRRRSKSCMEGAIPPPSSGCMLCSGVLREEGREGTLGN